EARKQRLIVLDDAAAVDAHRRVRAGDQEHPRTVVVISIDEVYFQCERAVMRAELWNGEHFADPEKLPTPGQMLKAATGDFDQETYDR
ncbi:hypothetical protein ACC775_38155, partial [Rhizobium ruizarguesonis]